ncbi:uncharacterized protein LOC135484263 isoform X2 [Lineus longissimus]|uniref:uncharacterized protein LOC135484263 isoform X2 n=1 Tax=Lineus longissimus TaxID=88925 RepID=UPI002B4F8DBB
MLKEATSILKQAVDEGRTDIIKSVISACGFTETEQDIKDHLLNSLSTDYGTILHLATKKGQTDIIRALLASGADPCIQNTDSQTPLDLAESTHVQHVYNEELLQAAAQSDIGKVCQLIAAGVNVNLIDSEENRNTPLHWAASFGDRKVIRSLCSRGANVNAINSQGATPLHDAVKRGSCPEVEELIFCGADPTIKATSGKYSGSSPIDLAKGNVQLLEVLKKQPIIPMNTMANGSISDKIILAKMSRSDSLDSSITNDVESLHSPRLVIENGPPGDEEVASSTPVKGDEDVIVSTPVEGDKVVTTSTPVKQSTSVEKICDLQNQSQVTTPPPPLVTDERLNNLWPQPQKIVQKDGKPFRPSEVLHFYIAEGVTKGSAHRILDILNLKKEELNGLAYEQDVNIAPKRFTTADFPVVCHINEQLFARSECYRLTITEHQIKITASDPCGFFYGLNTLIQLLRLCSREDGIPALQIHDWPSMKYRGVLLDFSKGRVPNIDTAKNLLGILSSLKINMVYLYTRFNAPNSQKWQFVYSKSDLLTLEKFCLERFIDLVPVLDVSPSVSYPDLSDLYYDIQEFISCFVSTRFISLGPRMSSFLLDTTEDDALVLDDAQKLLPLLRSHTPQVCAFVFHENLEAMQDIIPPDMMLLEFGFQADYNFHKYSKEYAEIGLPFVICPGTAAWNSLAGCPEAAIGNIYNAVKAASSHNALGVSVCHWAGVGHMTHQPFSWPGLVISAGLSWNSTSHWDYLHANLAQLLNNFVFFDEGSVMGQVILELGRAETYVIRCSRNQHGNDNSNLPAENGSTLAMLLSHPDEVTLDLLTAEIFQKTMRHIRKCQSEVQKAKLKCAQSEHIISEVQLTADLMLFACRVGRSLANIGRNPGAAADAAGLAVINVGIANLLPTTKTDLANRLLGLVEDYKKNWSLRNVSQSLQSSLTALTSIFKALVPEGQLAEP